MIGGLLVRGFREFFYNTSVFNLPFKHKFLVSKSVRISDLLARTWERYQL